MRGYNQLLDVVRGNCTVVQLQGVTGADINEQSKSGNAPLHLALRFGCSNQVLDWLLSQGANPDLANGRGQTPLTLGRVRIEAAQKRVAAAAGTAAGDANAADANADAADADAADADADAADADADASDAAPPAGRPRSRTVAAGGMTPADVDRKAAALQAQQTQRRRVQFADEQIIAAPTDAQKAAIKTLDEGLTTQTLKSCWPGERLGAQYKFWDNVSRDAGISSQQQQYQVAGTAQRTLKEILTEQYKALYTPPAVPTLCSRLAPTPEGKRKQQHVQSSKNSVLKQIAKLGQSALVYQTITGNQELASKICAAIQKRVDTLAKKRNVLQNNRDSKEYKKHAYMLGLRDKINEDLGRVSGASTRAIIPNDESLEKVLAAYHNYRETNKDRVDMDKIKAGWSLGFFKRKPSQTQQLLDDLDTITVINHAPSA